MAMRDRDKYEDLDEYETEYEDDDDRGVTIIESLLVFFILCSFGSFFGPSQSVIAERVIEESKSLLENPHLAERMSKPKHSMKILCWNKNFKATIWNHLPYLAMMFLIDYLKVELSWCVNINHKTSFHHGPAASLGDAGRRSQVWEDVHQISGTCSGNKV